MTKGGLIVSATVKFSSEFDLKWGRGNTSGFALDKPDCRSTSSNRGFQKFRHREFSRIRVETVGMQIRLSAKKSEKTEEMRRNIIIRRMFSVFECIQRGPSSEIQGNFFSFDL